MSYLGLIGTREQRCRGAQARGNISTGKYWHLEDTGEFRHLTGSGRHQHLVGTGELRYFIGSGNHRNWGTNVPLRRWGTSVPGILGNEEHLDGPLLRHAVKVIRAFRIRDKLVVIGLGLRVAM